MKSKENIGEASRNEPKKLVLGICLTGYWQSHWSETMIMLSKECSRPQAWYEMKKYWWGKWVIDLWDESNIFIQSRFSKISVMSLIFISHVSLPSYQYKCNPNHDILSSQYFTPPWNLQNFSLSIYILNYIGPIILRKFWGVTNFQTFCLWK